MVNVLNLKRYFSLVRRIYSPFVQLLQQSLFFIYRVPLRVMTTRLRPFKIYDIKNQRRILFIMLARKKKLLKGKIIFWRCQRSFQILIFNWYRIEIFHWKLLNIYFILFILAFEVIFRFLFAACASLSFLYCWFRVRKTYRSFFFVCAQVCIIVELGCEHWDSHWRISTATL